MAVGVAQKTRDEFTAMVVAESWPEARIVGEAQVGPAGQATMVPAPVSLVQ